MPNVGIWAQVPHYAAGMPFPGASVALLEGLAQVARIRVDLIAGELEVRSDGDPVPPLQLDPERLDEAVAL